MISKLENRFSSCFNLSFGVNHAILTNFFHSMFKLRWIPDHLDESVKKYIQNLYINKVEQYENWDKLNSSDVS